MATIKLGIRELVSFTLRSGDIRGTFLSNKRAVDGTKAHQKYQKKMQKLYDSDYEVEVSLKHKIAYDEDTLILSGRIDGVNLSEGVVIEEVKSTVRSLEHIEEPEGEHMAQLKIYAYIYSHREGLDGVGLKLIYIDLDTFEEKVFAYKMSLEALEKYFDEVTEKYMAFYHQVLNFEKHSRHTIEGLEFPFGGYRKGQKSLMGAVYQSIDCQQVLFTRAPTGIGKTIGTLYPSLKAISHGKSEKIFYLTAKTIGKEVARSTLDTLSEQGMKLKYIIITAKEKICPMELTACNPEDCPYAKGHYDRVNKAIDDVYKHHNCFDREVIEAAGLKHMVCPYELSLDLSLFAQVIICDYNYAFDPSAMLRRYFVEGSGAYTLLIDEAHNLVSRARGMYSAELNKDDILAIRRLVKPLDSNLYKKLGKVNAKMLEKRKALQELELKQSAEIDPPDDIIKELRGIIHRIEKIFAIHKNWPHMDALLEFFFDAYDFVKKRDLYSDDYISYYEREKSQLKVKMFCMNPADNLREVLNKMAGVIYFSATLSPMMYYMNLLGGNENSIVQRIGSPFQRDQMCLIMDDQISTKYADRKDSLLPIVRDIHQVVTAKSGHYLVFFPSYKYMNDVLEIYEPCCGEELIIQSRGQSEAEKEAFIQAFHEIGPESKLGFAVLGGMYGEGIDLTGDKLSGAIIVGVGLPMINYEGNLLKAHFANTYGKGFEYAYMYPGMNKVLQSAGRVIRTMTDQGVVLLIDSRFRQRDYVALFPDEWCHRRYVSQVGEIGPNLKRFWANYPKNPV